MNKNVNFKINCVKYICLIGFSLFLLPTISSVNQSNLPYNQFQLNHNIVYNSNTVVMPAYRMPMICDKCNKLIGVPFKGAEVPTRVFSNNQLFHHKTLNPNFSQYKPLRQKKLFINHEIIYVKNEQILKNAFFENFSKTALLSKLDFLCSGTLNPFRQLIQDIYNIHTSYIAIDSNKNAQKREERVQFVYDGGARNTIIAIFYEAIQGRQNKCLYFHRMARIDVKLLGNQNQYEILDLTRPLTHRAVFSKNYGFKFHNSWKTSKKTISFLQQSNNSKDQAQKALDIPANKIFAKLKNFNLCNDMWPYYIRPNGNVGLIFILRESGSGNTRIIRTIPDSKNGIYLITDLWEVNAKNEQKVVELSGLYLMNHASVNNQGELEVPVTFIE